MIAGNKERPVARYLPIDHVGEGYGPVSPADGETFIGIPYGWRTDNSGPFIEIVKDGTVVRTINALDLAEIEFAGE
jgi:hypothetical protein